MVEFAVRQAPPMLPRIAMLARQVARDLQPGSPPYGRRMTEALGAGRISMYSFKSNSKRTGL
jgi:hypothetical protein